MSVCVACVSSQPATILGKIDRMRAVVLFHCRRVGVCQLPQSLYVKMASHKCRWDITFLRVSAYCHIK
jgi:hypothetical protein